MKIRIKWLLLVLAFSISESCYKAEINRWDEFTVKEGSHRSTTRDLQWNKNFTVVYEYEFTESCKYSLGNNDQGDWNKVGGYSTVFHTNFKYSLMTAMWWDDVNEYWWLAPYVHDDGETLKVPHNDTGMSRDSSMTAIKLYPGQNFETHYTLNSCENRMYLTIIIPASGSSTFYELEVHDGFNRVREIFWYFGGTSEAPHDMTIRRRLVVLEDKP